VLKLVHFLGEASVLGRAMRASRHKIGVFLLTVLSVVVIVGSLMYVIEGPPAGFKNIPVSIYWAIVTLTTVGYGDIAPQTALGQALAALLMITGYGIIAVPTGIVTVELGRASAGAGHDKDAAHCKYCGARLEEATATPA
jgi:voltage-gated potassium channel